MANQRIYKHIAIRDETTWGVSATGTNKVIAVRTSTLNQNPNKAIVEETSTSIKGRDRMTVGHNEIDGDITGYASPRFLHHALEWVNGSQGATAALGTSAMTITYNQNVDGNLLSKTVLMDRNNTQEAFYGTRASKFSMNWANDLVEAALTLMAKSRGIGASVADVVGETVRPYEFADISVGIGGAAYVNPTVVFTSNGNFTYDNGQERSFLSGSRDAARTDPNIPRLNGSIEIFHEGNSFISPTYGCSELYIRIEATTVSCHGLIAGTTPYYTRIDIPRVQFTTNTRNYEQAALAMETIEFEAMFNPGTSSLWTATQVVGFDIEA